MWIIIHVLQRNSALPLGDCPQAGAIEARAISTGYILSTFYRPEEAPYGFRLDENINGNIHHHMFHFKADLDIGGTSNRYETLDMSEETVNLRQVISVILQGPYAPQGSRKLPK